MFPKILQIGMWALALLCSAVHAVEPPTLPAATQGLVFASMPGSGPSDTLILQAVRDKTDYRLGGFAAKDGKALGKFMPPGDYELVAARGQKLSKTYPLVTVVAGRVTDMGALVFVDLGDSKVVMLPTHNADSQRNLEGALADLGAAFSGSEPVVWRSAKVPEPFLWRQELGLRFGLLTDLQKVHESRTTETPLLRRMRETTSTDTFLSLAKTVAVPTTGKPVQDAQGRMFFGASLGQVRVRDAGGVWSSIDTGCLHTVTAVESWGEQLLAGYDNGDVRRSLDGGKTWTVVASLERRMPVIDISRVAEQWLVTTVRPKYLRNGLASMDQVSVYNGSKDDFSDIRKNRDLEVESEPLVRASASAFKGYYYVNAFPKLWRLDTATMQWRAVGPDTEVHGFQIAPATGTLAAYRIKGGFSKLFVSTDLGDTWAKYDNPPYVIMDIRFANATQGQAVRWNMGALSGTLELLDYDRAKDSWTKTAEAPAGCRQAFVDASSAIKLCVTPDGNILSLAQGKWAIEFAAD
jgi:hypothetical protein